jgi:hypothetical protein
MASMQIDTATMDATFGEGFFVLHQAVVAAVHSRPRAAVYQCIEVGVNRSMDAGANTIIREALPAERLFNAGR